MPRGDRTGPAGAGPMTGRAAGFCAGFNRPGFQNMPGMGGGFGGGRGRAMRSGFGFWNRPWPQVAPQAPAACDEKESLKNEAAYLKSQLESIQQRLEEIDNQEN